MSTSSQPGFGPDIAYMVLHLRSSNEDKFQNMVKAHLSFLLDLPHLLGSSLKESLMTPSSAPDRSKSRSFFKRKHKESKQEFGVFGCPLSDQSILQMKLIMDFLEKPENLQQEGLFRKSGNCSRQRILKDQLNNSEILQVDSNFYSVHDCATVLKTFLGDLPEPLLSERLYKALCQVPGMTVNGSQENKQAVENKQVEALQLMVLLLPRENLVFLRHLLHLLNLVACTQGNRMTATTLGAMFAPHLLVPRKVTAGELQEITPTVTKVVSFMIEKTAHIMKIPDALAMDIETYWQNVGTCCSPCPCCSDQSSHHTTQKKRHADALYTNVAFADRKASQQAAQETDTQLALAQLYAYVSAMPESNKKRKLMKQFNKANGYGTPAHSGKKEKRHKRSKSFGEGLIKMKSQVHIVDMGKQLTKLQLPKVPPRHKRKLTTPAVPTRDLRRTMSREMCSVTNMCNCGSNTEGNCENCDVTSSKLVPTTAFLNANTTTPFKTGYVHPFISPITKSVKRIPKSLQAVVMTPRSRVPVAMFHTP